MTMHPTTRIRFLGVAAYEILTRDGLRILCDPFLDQNPGAPTKSTEFDQVDLVIVSHAAFDHLGDTDKIAAKYGCPVVCGGEVKAWLMDRGIPASRSAPRPGASASRSPASRSSRSNAITGRRSGCRTAASSPACRWPSSSMPTTICASTTTATPRSSRDLKLQAELYKPNVGCIGIANPQEILHLNPMPGEMLTGEMSPYEGVLAAQWLGLETVLPCHYITLDGDQDVAEYMTHHRAAQARGEAIADPYLLRAGDWIEFDAAGKVVRPAKAA